ncbi:MAG: MarR family winged helix-turn-helix transcriptional regulator [Caulobacterales bacterium]|jgi:DNA-binding MarR family transcriptional regulator
MASKTSDFALARSVSHLLHRAQQFAADRFAAELGRTDLTLRQFALLAAVGEQAGQTQTDLVRATGIDRSTLADMIGRMEDRGLVVRDKAESDKRAKSVTLTAQGRSMLNAAAPSAIAADRALMSALPVTKQGGLMAALVQIAEAAEAQAASAPASAPKTSKAPARRAAPVAKPAARGKAKPAAPVARAKEKPAARGKAAPAKRAPARTPAKAAAKAPVGRKPKKTGRR